MIHRKKLFEACKGEVVCGVYAITNKVTCSILKGVIEKSINDFTIRCGVKRIKITKIYKKSKHFCEDFLVQVNI